MKKSITLILPIFIAATLLLITDAWSDKLLDQGKTIYSTNCQLCHGTDGKGDGPASSALNPKPADYTSAKFWTTDAATKIAETIKKGKGQMPPFGLDKQSVQAVIYYIEHTFKPADAPKPQK